MLVHHFDGPTSSRRDFVGTAQIHPLAGQGCAKGNPDEARRSARTIPRLVEPGRYADGGGLYLLVAPGGSRSWMLRTVIRGKRSDIGLGSATLVSLAEAREEARRLRKIARSGGDPLSDRRQARRGVPTFEDAAKQVHSIHGASFKNEKHRKQWLASLKRVFT